MKVKCILFGHGLPPASKKLQLSNFSDSGYHQFHWISRPMQAPLRSSKYHWPGAEKEQTVVGQNMLVTPHSFRKKRVGVQEGQITKPV